MKVIMQSIFLVGLGLFAISCAGSKRPAWPDNPGSMDDPRAPDMKHFVGVSERYATERLARTASIDHAAEQILTYLGIFSEQFIVDVVITDAMSREIMDVARKKDVINRRFSDSFMAGIAGRQYYVQQGKEKDLYGDMRGYWKVYVLVPFSRKESDKAINVAIEAGKNKELIDRARQLAEKAWEGHKQKLLGNQ